MQLFPRQTADVREYKLINWQVDVVDRIERHFRAAEQQALAACHPERLYVSQNKAHRTIQLFFGQHPVGRIPGSSALAIERGAALVLSQGPTGAVAIFLYPYESELGRRQENLIVWGVFDDPLDITDRVLKRAIADFTCYARVSSVLDGGTQADRKRIDRLLRRDHFQSPANVDTAKLAEEKRREEKEARPGWGARLANHPLFVLFAILGTVVTVVGGWQSFVDQLHRWRDEILVASGHPPPGTAISAAAQPSSAAMPVITGWYTFCPQDRTGASPRLLDLLYDIGQYRGKVAFFDVQVHIDCVMTTPFDPTATVSRDAKEQSLTYSFGPGMPKQGDVDGDRVAAKLDPLLPGNGTSIRVLDDRDGRNALTRLGINSEGVDDELYGPYLIKARYEDATLDLELSAPTLDSSMQEAATTIAEQRRTAHEHDLSPKGAPQPIRLSPADLQRFHSAGSSAPLGVRPPAALPPLPTLDAGSLGRLPPLPPPVPRPASGPDAAANPH